MKSLLLALLLAASLRCQATDPTTQLINTLNTASLQLQALGTLTLNNNTYVQLVQVLNVVFGNLRTSVMPYYYSQMSRILAMNGDMAQRVLKVNDNIGAVTNVLRSYVDTLYNNYAQQVAAIGARLFAYQLDASERIDGLASMAQNITDQIAALQGEMQVLYPFFNQANQQLDSILSQEQSLLQVLPSQLNPSNKTIESFNLTDISLGSTGLSYCQSFIYNFPMNYNGQIPQVAANINLLGPEATANTAYDIVVAAITPIATTVWICDRSLTRFTLRPARLFLMVWTSA